jgi:hypothetical protein
MNSRDRSENRFPIYWDRHEMLGVKRFAAKYELMI